MPTNAEIMRALIDQMEAKQQPQLLNEFLTKNSPQTKLQPDHQPDQPGYTFTTNDREYYVGFRGSDGEYYMSFTGQDDRGKQSARLLGHGKPFSVFAGILSALVTFIKKYKPKMIEFSVESDETERVSTYDRMFETAERRGLIPKGYVWDRDGNYNYFIFKAGYR